MDDTRLAPRAVELYAVRWVRADGRDVKHRFFTRRHDALVYADKITRYGRAPEVFRAPVGAWLAVAGEES